MSLSDTNIKKERNPLLTPDASEEDTPSTTCGCPCTHVATDELVGTFINFDNSAYVTTPTSTSTMQTDFVCTRIYTEEDMRKVCKNFTDGGDIMEDHHDSAKEDLKNLIALANGRVVTEFSLISTNCGEMAPCLGHVGLNITYSDGSSERFECGSFSIGAITKYHKHMLNDKIVVKDAHCEKWVSQKFLNELLGLF